MRRGVCKNILYNNAMQLIKNDDVKIIDVREANEVNDNYLPGSINVPVNELIDGIKQIAPDKNQAILVYCSTGSRSIFACQILVDLGYNRVYNLYGGLH